MEGKLGLLFFILLGSALASVARQLSNVTELNGESDVCSLCEEYSTEILDYVKDNKTQLEIIDSLHNSCHKLLSFNQQCIELVDYYAPLFFTKLDPIKPGELCEKFNLCESAKISLRIQGNSCGLCKDIVAALLVELNDPETKLEIIQKLLKVCNSMDKIQKECKRMIFEYGPLILINAEKFLKTTDICTTILHACPASTMVSQEATIMEETPLLSDS